MSKARQFLREEVDVDAQNVEAVTPAQPTSTSDARWGAALNLVVHIKHRPTSSYSSSTQRWRHSAATAAKGCSSPTEGMFWMAQ